MALPALLPAGASSVSAQTASATETEFQFVALSSAGKIGGVEHFMAASGNGTISSIGVDGGGAFTHYDNAASRMPKTILGSGTWRATRLLGFKEVGSFGSLVAGIADLEVELTRAVPVPATFMGRLRIVSNLVPAGFVNLEPSGFALSLLGGPIRQFKQLSPNVGMTIFSKVAAVLPGEAPPADSAAASPEGEAPITQADEPSKALTLDWTKPLKGHLAAGGAKGRFAYYKFDYPGGSAPFTVDLHVLTERYDVLEQTGFNVYGPIPGHVFATGGRQINHRPNISGNLESLHPGIYTVQVYNHHPAMEIDFEIGGTQGAAPTKGRGLPPGEDGVPDDGGPDI